MDAKSILDSLLKGGADLGGKARGSWDQQSTGTKGALAGGLLGVLMGGRGGVSSVVRVGGAALIGSLASRAYADWQAGKDPLASVTQALGLSGGSDPADDPALTEAFATRLLRAVVAAAKADGHVSDEERARIAGQMEKMGMDDETRALIEQDLAGPLDIDAVAMLAGTPEEASRIYTTTLLLVDEQTDRAYLDALAGAMNLDPALVAHLEAGVRRIGD